MITVNKSNNILKVATGGDTVNITNAYEDNRFKPLSFVNVLMKMMSTKILMRMMLMDILMRTMAKVDSLCHYSQFSKKKKAVMEI